MRYFITFFYRFFLLLGLVGLITTFSLICYLEKNLPDINTLKQVGLQIPLKIYTSDLKLIGEYGDKRRTPITMDEVPDLLIKAILATEDHRFYLHNGVDLRGIMRAAITLISTGNKEQGGSTITMQVARNFFLTRHKTYARKLNEILLSLKIEQYLTKDEILNLYLNKIYFGKRAYGVAAAAEVYYGTQPKNLTLAQMAMLAGLPQAPSTINPLNSPQAALKRREHVLSRMLNYGYIDQTQYDIACASPLDAKYYQRQAEVDAPFVAEMVRQELIKRYGNSAYDQGLTVITTIDSKMQTTANRALDRALLEYTERNTPFGPTTYENDKIGYSLERGTIVKRTPNNLTIKLKDITIELPKSQWQWIYNRATLEKYTHRDIEDALSSGQTVYVRRDYSNNSWRLAQVPEAEAAFIALEPKTGKILALNGGFDGERTIFNRVTQAERQPGSAFKPFIYSAALMKNFTPASIINDAPITETTSWDNDWRPQNHNLKFNGPTRLREGLTKSRNLVSIRILREIGIEYAIDVAERFGFNGSMLPHGLSLALGSCTVTPLKLTQAYCPFANGGNQVEVQFIDQIKDYHNKVIYQANYQPGPEVIPPQIAYMMQSMLQDTIKSGTGRKAQSLKRNDLAGKSGTTNDQVDAWFAGFNKDVVATAWLGFDEPKSLKEYGANAALPMWIYFMQDALAGKADTIQIQPTGLATVRIDPESGLLARDNQKNAIYEVFLENTIPVEYAKVKTAVAKKIVPIDSIDGDGAERNADASAGVGQQDIDLF